MKKMKKRYVTIRDVARLAGVSTASVSSVLNNNHSIRLSDRTRSHILKTIRAAGYTYRKRKSVTGKPLSIAVFSRWPLRNPFTFNVLKGIERTLVKDGGRMFVNLTEESTRQIASGNSSILDGIKGAIFTSRIDPLCAEALKMRSIPFVVAGSGEYYDSCDMVYCDPLGYCREALSYLTSLGHRKVGLLVGPLPHFSYEVSILVFKNYLAQFCPGREHRYLKVVASEQDFHAATLELLNGADRPTALVGELFDSIAAVEQMGLRIPQDISILAYDTAGILTHRPLTYVGCDQGFLGKLAVELLRTRITWPQEPTRHVVVPVQVYNHGSCSRIENQT